MDTRDLLKLPNGWQWGSYIGHDNNYFASNGSIDVGVISGNLEIDAVPNESEVSHTVPSSVLALVLKVNGVTL